MKADAGHIINTSSVNGFYACTGPNIAHTAYSSAKFAVKGFTEGLMVDCKLHAPHVKVSLVMPGHIGTDINLNLPRIMYGYSAAHEMTPEEIADARAKTESAGVSLEGVSDDELKMGFLAQGEGFRDNAPMTSATAADVILDGVRNEKWRILVGTDAHVLDKVVREHPEDAYDDSIMQHLMVAMEEAGMNATEWAANVMGTDAE